MLKRKSAIPIFLMLIVIISVMVSQAVSAVPADPMPKQVTQADGTAITITGHGDEFFHWAEDADGYVIAYDSDSKNWCYAYIEYDRIAPEPSAVVGSAVQPFGGRLKSREIIPLYDKAVQQRAVDGPLDTGIQRSSGDTDFLKAPGLQDQEIILLLVEFDDRPLEKDEQYWWNMYFDTSAGAKSVVNYYREMSHGFNIFKPATTTTTITATQANRPTSFEGSLADWAVTGTNVTVTQSTKQGVVKVKLHRSHPIPNYTAEPNVDNYERAIMEIAVRAVYQNSSFNFSNPNLHIAGVIAGYDWSGQFSGGVGQGQVWAHKWNFLNSVIGGSASSWRIYMLHGEMSNASETMQIGVACHELGHTLGLPDLYDTTYESDGLGPYSLMAGGSWGAISGHPGGSTPTALDAWSKIQLGYIIPEVVDSTGYLLRNMQAFNPAVVNNNPYNALKITSAAAGKPDQYFLVENRFSTSWDLGFGGLSHPSYPVVPGGGGIIIYHIDDALPDTRPNNNYLHKRVDVEEADGVWANSLDNITVYQNYNNHFFKNASGYDAFNNTTTPNSRFYTGNIYDSSDTQTIATGIKVNIKSAVGASMTVEVGDPRPVDDIVGVPAFKTYGSDLTLHGVVEPHDAKQDIVWTVKTPGTPNGVIDPGTNILKTTNNIANLGIVTVTATVIDGGISPGTNFTKDFNIEVIDKTAVDITGLTIADMIYSKTEHEGLQGTPVFKLHEDGTTVVAPDVPTLTVTYGGEAEDGSTYGPTATPPTKAGFYEVQVILAGDGEYYGEEEFTFEITQKTLTWQAGTVEDKTYDGTTNATVATAPTLSGVITGDVVNIVVGAVHFSSANQGSRTVTASGYGITSPAGPNANDFHNYTVGTAQPTFGPAATINRLNLTFTAGTYTVSKTYDGTTDAGAPAGALDVDPLPAILAADTADVIIAVTAGAYPNADAGDYTVSVGLAFETPLGGDAVKRDNYNLVAASVNVPGEILPAPYSGSTLSMARYVVAGSTKPVSLSLASLKPSVLVGELGTVSYEYVSHTTTNGIINGTPAVSGTSPNFNLNFNVNSVSTVGVTDTIALSIVTQNYGTIPATVTLTTSEKLPLILSGFDIAATKVYDGLPLAYTGSAVFEDYDEAIVTDVTGALVATYTDINTSTDYSTAPKNAGTYTVTVTLIDDPEYTAQWISEPFTITPKPLTWSDGTVFDKDYDTLDTATIETTPELNGVITIGGVADDVDADPGTVTFLDKDAEPDKTVLAAGWGITGADAGNYDEPVLQPVFANAAIFPLEIEITPITGLSKLYGTAEPPFSALGSHFTASPLLLDGSFTGALGREPGENVGDYAYTGGDLSAGGNYNLTLVGGVTFAITPATIGGVNQPYEVATASDIDYNFNLTTLLPNISPLVFGPVTYDPVITTNTDGILDALDYTGGDILVIPVLGGDVGDTAEITVTIESLNYTTITSTITVQMVDKNPVDISATMAGGVYNGDPYEYANLVLTDKITGEVLAATPTSIYVSYEGINGTDYPSDPAAPVNAGNYRLTLRIIDPAYTGVNVFEFTISKKEVTVKADNYTINQNAALPTPTVTYTGFVGTDDETNALDIEAEAKLNVANSSTAGTSTIDFETQAVLNDSNGANYTLAHQNGTLTINKTGSTPPPYTPPPTDDTGGGTGGTTTETEETKETAETPDTTEQTVHVDIDGHDFTVVLTTDGEGGTILDLVLSMADIEKLTDDTNILKITVSGQEKIIVSLPAAAFAAGMTNEILVINTDFGTITIPKETLNVLQEIFGDTIRISITKGSFKVALLDSKDEEIPYNNPKNPLTVTLPYELKLIEKDEADEEEDGEAEEVRENADFVVAVRKDGETEVKIPYGVYDEETKTITFDITQTGTYDVIYNAKEVGGVDEHWAEDDINFIAARSLIDAAVDFEPGTLVTRAMFANMFAKIELVDLSKYADADPTFIDVSEDDWYFAAVQWAAEAGIINGIGDDMFDPDALVTREQMATMLDRYIKYKGWDAESDKEKIVFDDDADIAEWAAEAVENIQLAGIIIGKPENLYDPKGITTMAEYATIFARLIRIYSN